MVKLELCSPTCFYLGAPPWTRLRLARLRQFAETQGQADGQFSLWAIDEHGLSQEEKHVNVDVVNVIFQVQRLPLPTSPQSIRI